MWFRGCLQDKEENEEWLCQVLAKQEHTLLEQFCRYIEIEILVRGKPKDPRSHLHAAEFQIEISCTVPIICSSAAKTNRYEPPGLTRRS